MVDNSAGLLEWASGRAGSAPARVSRTPAWRGHAVILVATRPLVARGAGFACACPVGHHDHETAESPVLTPNAHCPPCPGALPPACVSDVRRLAISSVTPACSQRGRKPSVVM